MSRYFWKINGELFGKEHSKEDMIRIDSYECFNCCLESEEVTSVLLLPDSILEFVQKREIEKLKLMSQTIKNNHNIKEEVRSGTVFLAGTTEGTIHVFSSFSPVKVVKK